MYKAIIFDFFDVIHSDPSKAWLLKHGIKDLTGFNKVMRPLDLGKTTVDEFYQSLHELTGHTKESIRADFAETILLDDRMLPYIKALGKSYKIGLLSNAGVEEIRPLIDRHGYHEFFDHIVISAEVGLMKPDSEVFKHILEKLDCQPTEAIFIDDNPVNVEAAKKLGITGIVFRDFSSFKKEIEELTKI